MNVLKVYQVNLGHGTYEAHQSKERVQGSLLDPGRRQYCDGETPTPYLATWHIHQGTDKQAELPPIPGLQLGFMGQHNCGLSIHPFVHLDQVLSIASTLFMISHLTLAVELSPAQPCGCGLALQNDFGCYYTVLYLNTLHTPETASLPAKPL